MLLKISSNFDIQRLHAIFTFVEIFIIISSFLSSFLKVYTLSFFTIFPPYIISDSEIVKKTLMVLWVSKYSKT